MEPSEILRWLAEALERLQIPYLVTGSMATIAYGEPRFTNDIDVVVALRLDQVDAFCGVVPGAGFSLLSRVSRPGSPAAVSVQHHPF